MSIELELAKSTVGPLLTALLAWVVGNRLTARWAMRQKRRDDAREAANQFYRLYGEFFAVWKLWNYHVKLSTNPDSAGQRWELLKRATTAEAGIEAFLVKVASERVLAPADIEALGRFRQGYQSLRQAIRDAKALDWQSSEHPEYSRFKRLSAHAGRLVSTVDQGRAPSIESAQNAILTITANSWEGKWHVGA